MLSYLNVILSCFTLVDKTIYGLSALQLACCFFVVVVSSQDGLMD